MVFDERVERAKRLMGKRLKAYREAAGLSVPELAKLADVHRTTINGIETGRHNFTIEMMAALLSKCGVSIDEFLSGFRSTEAPPAHQDFHRMLSIILNSGIEDQIHGIRVNLEAISEKVARLMKARADPSRPEPRETGHAKKNKHAS